MLNIINFCSGFCCGCCRKGARGVSCVVAVGYGVAGGSLRKSSVYDQTLTVDACTCKKVVERL